MTELLRQLVRQLRRLHKQGSVRQTPMYNYMIEQYRAHLVTGSKLCKHQDELRHVAQTYLCLLESTARQQELASLYSRGERTVKESANLVGLRLPEDSNS